MYRTPYAHIFILIAFLANTFGPIPFAQAQDFRLPAAGVMVRLSPEFNPPVLKGIKVHPDNPFRFDFILDKGDGQLSNDALKDESSKLIKYFLASLTIPEKDLWVNLSPYEKNRIIPDSFGLTEMGRDLLAEDYMLKQITASLIYPEDAIGKKFWKRIYEEAAKKFGTTNIPVNTFNKVWIVPEKAVVYENAEAGTAYVVESKLKVMLEQDYLSMQKHKDAGGDNVNRLGSRIIREIVIPELTKEVNEDRNFIQLRQVYNSLILATWYKKKIKDSILAQVYENKNKIFGVNIDDPQEKQKIYQRYLQAFKKGAYNYIKEETDPITRQSVPRKYFSGGVGLTDMDLDHAMTVVHDFSAPSSTPEVQVTADLTTFSKSPGTPDVLMTADEVEASVLGSLAKAMDISNDQMQARLYRSIVEINGRKIKITQYKNRRDESVPFLRVGPFIIIEDRKYDLLEDNVKKYGFLIRRISFYDHIWANADIDYNELGWSGYMIGVLASMAAHEDQIKGSSFIDFGAGFSGVLAVAAEKLGAAEIILIEEYERHLQLLKINLENNNVTPGILQFYQENIVAMRALRTKKQKVAFVLDLPSYGAASSLTELPAALEILMDKTIKLAVVSGGLEGSYPKAMDMLIPEFDVSKAIISKGPSTLGGQDRFFTTLVATAKTDADKAQTAEEKIKKVIDESPEPLTVKEISEKSGVRQETIRPILARNQILNLKVRKEIKRRTREEIEESYASLKFWLDQGPYTAPELAKKTKKAIEIVWLDLNRSGLIKHPNFVHERESRTPVQIESNRAELKILLDNQEGREYSVEELARILKREVGAVYYDLDSIGYENHPNLLKRDNIIDRLDFIMNKISKEKLSRNEKYSLLINLRFKSVQVFKKRQIDLLLSKRDLLERLVFFKRVLSYRRFGEMMFSPAQAFIMTRDYKSGMEEDVYAKIDWLMAQGISENVPLFSNNDILSIILSRQSFEMIKDSVVFLRQKRSQEGHVLFNGYYISNIIFGRHTMGEIDELIQFLASKENGNKRFNGSQISTILSSRMDMETKKTIISYLCKQGYNEADITIILSRKISLKDDIEPLDKFLRKEGIFSGANMGYIIYKKTPVDTKIDFIKFLLAQKDGDNERVFNGFDIERIIFNSAPWQEKKNRVQYFLDQENIVGKPLFDGGEIRWAIDHYEDFNKSVFEAVLNIFKNADVENKRALYWAVETRAYKAFIEEWLSRDFKDLSDDAKKVIYALYSRTETEGVTRAFATEFDDRHLDALLGILFKGEQLQDVRRKMAGRQERLSVLFRDIAGRTLRDGDEDIIRNLLMSPDVEQRKILIGRIIQNLNGFLIRMHKAYNGNGDIIFWEVFKRYDWLRPDASLENLQGRMRFLLTHKNVGIFLSHFYQLSLQERRLLQSVDALRGKGWDDQSIVKRLTQRGYSSYFIAQGLRRFKTMSLDAQINPSDPDPRNYLDLLSSDHDADVQGSEDEGGKVRVEVIINTSKRTFFVMAANVMEAIIALQDHYHIKPEIFEKIANEVSQRRFTLSVNGEMVFGSQAAKYHLEEGDLIELTVPGINLDAAMAAENNPKLRLVSIARPASSYPQEYEIFNFEIENSGSLSFHSFQRMLAAVGVPENTVIYYRDGHQRRWIELKDGDLPRGKVSVGVRIDEDEISKRIKEEIPKYKKRTLQKILVVDDNPQTELINTLSNLGYNVVTADDGQSAWKLLNATGASFDAIISDLEMKEVNGDLLFAWIRESKSSLLRNTPFLFRTTEPLKVKDLLGEEVKGQDILSKDVPAVNVGKILDRKLGIDKAMIPSNTGGIDLTSSKVLSIQNNGQGIKFHIDPAMLQQLQNAPGFIPVIINIQPVADLRAFLGLSETAQP